MKTLIVIGLSISIFLTLAILAKSLHACSSACTEREGVCACDAPSGEKIQVSSEKPPRSGKPSWEAKDVRAEVTVSSGTEDQSGMLPNGGVPIR